MNHPLIAQISTWLTGRELRHEAEGERIVTGFGGLAEYRDLEGQPRVGLIIRICEDGEFLTLDAPLCYRIPANHEHKAAALETALQSVRHFKMLRWEYDPADGALRASIHVPIEDSELTAKLFFRALYAMPQLIDAGAAAIQRAIATGRVETTPVPVPSSAVFGAFAAALGSLVAALTGKVPEPAPKRAARFDLGHVDPSRN